MTSDRPNISTYNDVRGSFNKYRSISYGTWKPGEARRFSEKSKRRLYSEEPINYKNFNENRLNHIQQFSHHHQQSNLSIDSKTLVPTEDEVSEIEHCKTEPITSSVNIQTTPSLFNRKNQKMTISFDPDCYSSAEYLNYYIHENSKGFRNNMPLSKVANRSMDALNDRLIHSDKRKNNNNNPSTSSTFTSNKINDNYYFNQPLHQRTRSFDCATRFAVIQPGKGVKLSTFGQKQQNNSNQKTSAFQATKNFLKKLYTNSTTLPKKLRSSNKNQQQKIDTFKAATSPFYEIRYPEPEELPYLPYNIQYEIESDNDDEETELDVETAELDSSAPSCSSSNHEKNKINNLDEGIFSGSEDKSVTGSEFTTQSYGTASSSGSTKRDTFIPPPPPSVFSSSSSSTQKNFESWNDLFGHLKKEITEMRERDQQILESLKTVESQLSYVRGLDRSKSEYSPLSKLLTASTTIPAGSRPLNSTSSNNIKSTII